MESCMCISGSYTWSIKFADYSQQLGGNTKNAAIHATLGSHVYNILDQLNNKYSLYTFKSVLLDPRYLHGWAKLHCSGLTWGLAKAWVIHPHFTSERQGSSVVSNTAVTRLALPEIHRVVHWLKKSNIYIFTG